MESTEIFTWHLGPKESYHVRGLDEVGDVKTDILFTAGVLILVGSLAQLSVCQNQTERPGVTSLSDCTHRREAVGPLANPSIEHIVIAPVLGKTISPKIGTTSGGVVIWKSVVVNGRPLTVITPDAGNERCILREDWDNTQASVDNER